jgi:hypothetical protein
MSRDTLHHEIRWNVGFSIHDAKEVYDRFEVVNQ